MTKRIFGTETELGALKKKLTNDRIEWRSVQIGKEERERLEELTYRKRIYTSSPSGTADFILNGGRIYVDVGHVEYATPECSLPEEVVAAEIAGCVLLAESFKSMNYEGGVYDIIFVKDNVGFLSRDSHGIDQSSSGYAYGYNSNEDRQENVVSFGYHENYSLDDRAIFQQCGVSYSTTIPVFSDEKCMQYIISRLVPFFITRQIIAGTGTCIFGPFILSSRSAFIRNIFGFCTHNVLERPIINTRHEPHGNRFRFHVIVGECTMAEIASILKIGTTGLVLRLMEEGKLPEKHYALYEYTEQSLIPLTHAIAHDISCTQKMIRMKNGDVISPCDFQRRFYDAAARWYPATDDPPEIKASTKLILDWWLFVLNCLDARESHKLIGILDWPTKMDLMRRLLLKRYDLTIADLPHGVMQHQEKKKIAMHLRAIEQRYHEISDRGYYSMLQKSGVMRSIIPAERVAYLMHNPPHSTRAHDRGRIIQWVLEHADKIRINSINWDHISLKRLREKQQPELQIAMPDPFIASPLPIEDFLRHNGMERLLSHHDREGE